MAACVFLHQGMVKFLCGIHAQENYSKYLSDRPIIIDITSDDCFIGFGYVSSPINQYKIVSLRTKRIFDHTGSGYGLVSLMSCHIYTLKNMGDHD